MAMHNTNSLLKYVIPIILIIITLLWITSFFSNPDSKVIQKNTLIKNPAAAHDSAAESLDTLTAELSETKQQILTVVKNNEVLKKENNELLQKLENKTTAESSQLSSDIKQLKNQIQNTTQIKMQNNNVTEQPITIVSDLTKQINAKTQSADLLGKNMNSDDVKSIAYYTIPANATSVQDRLMTALVGRIPIKGVVTDPYPFKIVISDDNLAANGLRIPNLLKMIVSGYCEGDLNLVSVRGWITSLTFVFDDGIISTTTSNENDIGNFTKSNSLGYLSDKYGNPFIRGKLITNAPAYLSGNIAIGAATGAANAYAQSQTTSSDTSIGTSIAVTGSQGKFVAGQALSNSASQVQQWWHDREEQSFDAIYVAPTDDKGEYIEIAVNFAKEIHIDYDPKGRKLNYANQENSFHTQLD